MMPRRWKGIVAASVGSVVVATTVAVLALANTATDSNASSAEDLVAESHEAKWILPPPATGWKLFTTASSTCTTAPEVALLLSMSRDQLGGETMVLARGLDQAFSDTWRAQVGVAPIHVSSVLAHAFADAVGPDLTVEVVEVDSRGCAVSRTLMAGDDWNAIIGASRVPTG